MQVDPTLIIDYTYEEFIEGINTIAKQIQDSNFQPDYVVGIVRGGSVPATYLSHKLKIPATMVHWSYRDSYTCESNCWIPEDINHGKRVLVIDDIVDGGMTIETLIEDWQRSVHEPLKLENIKVAAMWFNTALEKKIDYYHREINRNTEPHWVIMPWENA